MSSGLFESYEQDFTTLAAALAKKVAQQLPALAGEPKRSLLRTIERELEEADEILHSMEMELASLPPATKNRLQPKLRGYRAEYDQLKSNVNKERTKTSDRAQLLAGLEEGGFDAEVANQDQRQRLLAGTSRLNDASRRLEESHRVALETEQVGTEILTTLGAQRQQIVNANARMDEANTFMDRNMRILKNMTRRMATNRAMSILIIVALLFIIGLILYIKFA